MFCVYSETAAMAGKAVTIVLLVALCVSSSYSKALAGKDALAEKVAVAGIDAAAGNDAVAVEDAVAEKVAMAKDAVAGWLAAAEKDAVADNDADLASEIQSLREKTAKVFHRHFNYYY